MSPLQLTAQLLLLAQSTPLLCFFSWLFRRLSQQSWTFRRTWLAISVCSSPAKALTTAWHVSVRCSSVSQSVGRTKHVFAPLLSDCIRLRRQTYRRPIFAISTGWNPSDSRRPHFTQTKKLRTAHTLADRFEITFVESAQPFRGDRRRGK